ncbi:MAG: hypothetical protein GC168_16485 [Candidatus Hydrogenedens sp.]|nr:hypothetical protein [Candidatus Hydrogenedens sp.]
MGKKVHRQNHAGRMPAAALLLFLCGTFAAGAQEPVLDRVTTLGNGFSNLEATAMDVDTSGNVYTAGSFRLTTDFDSGSGVFELTASNIDVFVQKLDADGTFEWAVSYGTTGNGNSISDIVVDSAGSVYVTGGFSNTADFDPGAGTAELTSAGSSDIYVLKLDADGGYEWARRMGGTDSDTAYAIAVDASGNVYITGEFRDTVDFDPGAGTTELTCVGGTDSFVCKLDADGDFVWAVGFGGTSTDRGTGIGVDASGSVYTCGVYFMTVDFDPGAGTSELSVVGSADVYIQKLDSTGAFVWAVSNGGGSNDSPNDLVLDAGANVYTTGFNRNGGDYDPGPGTLSLPNAGLTDIYVQKLDTDGGLIWAVSMGGTGDEQGNSIDVDVSGNVYVTGQYAGTVDFEPGTGTTAMTSAGGNDIFVAKLDAAGALEWARSMGDTASDTGVAAAAYESDKVFVSGVFFGTVDFDPTAGMQEVTSAGGVGVSDSFTLVFRSQYAPVANDDTGAVSEDAVLAVVNGAAASLLDNDADDNPGDMLSVTAFDAVSAQGATVSVNTDGTFTYDPTGAAALQALNDGDDVVATFTYTVSDGIDDDTATVSITVSGADEDTTPPEFLDLTVVPSEAVPGEGIVLTFASSETLATVPTVTVDGDSADYDIGVKGGSPYAYTYTVPSNAPLGPAEIEISGIDLAGNSGILTTSAALTIVEPILPVPVLAWPAAVAFAVAGIAALRRKR